MFHQNPRVRGCQNAPPVFLLKFGPRTAWLSKIFIIISLHVKITCTKDEQFTNITIHLSRSYKYLNELRFNEDALIQRDNFLENMTKCTFILLSRIFSEN